MPADCGQELKLMQGMRTCGGLAAVSLLAWLLLVPPLSISGAGKTVVDITAPVSRWEALSKHSSAAECSKHRDDLRAQLEKAAPSTGGSDQNPSAKRSNKPSDKSKAAFATLKERAAAARCVADNDPRLRPPSAQTH
jgi:hypothetical protein